MSSPLSQQALDQLFTTARTHHGWLPEPVSDPLLRRLYDLMKWAPTCVNGAPARILFLRSKEAREKLIPALMPKNVEKTRAAPMTAILAYDLEWYEQLPKLSPQADYRSLYVGNKELADATAFRNGSLQGAYFIMAVRSLGLDVGPMSGFDLGKVNETFFAGSSWRANFLCNFGWGDNSKLYPRAPRLEFSEACRII